MNMITNYRRYIRAVSVENEKIHSFRNLRKRCKQVPPCNFYLQFHRKQRSQSFSRKNNQFVVDKNSILNK